MHPTPPWHIVGASVAGTSHLQQGDGCDDTHMYEQHSSGSLILAVADGAGSARHGAVGAHTAVYAAINAIGQILDEQDDLISQDKWECAIENVLQDTQAEIADLLVKSQEMQLKEAESPDDEQTLALGDFATTLLIAIVTPVWIVAAQIGDGAIVVQYDDQTVDVLTQPNHGEYFNQTSFVTDHDYLQYVQITSMQHVPTVKGIAMLTDGLENLALDFATKAAYPPFFLPLFRFAERAESSQEELEAFLSSERVCKQTDDDKTILLAVRT
jgi:Protein phosphatase 2C